MDKSYVDESMSSSLNASAIGGKTPAERVAAARAKKRKGLPETNATTWEASLKEYESHHSTMQFAPEPVTRHTRKMGREWTEGGPSKFNTILQRPVSLERSAELTRAEDEKRVRQVNRGMQKELEGTEVGYDILNFLPRYGLSDQQVDEAYALRKKTGTKYIPPASAVDYNILNLHSYYEEAPQKEGASVRAARPKRDFNPVTGEFYANHKERFEARQAAIREETIEKFIQTRVFDPITGRYYDSEREHNQQRVEDAEAKRKVEQVNTHGSTAVKKSEGFSYNVLTGEVKDPTRTARWDALATRGVDKRKEFRHRNAEFVDKLLEYGRKREAMSVQRKVTKERVGESVRLGFHIISNAPLGLSHAERRTADAETLERDALHGRSTAAVSLDTWKPKSVGARIEEERRAVKTETARAAPSTSHEHLFHSPKTLPRVRAEPLAQTV